MECSCEIDVGIDDDGSEFTSTKMLKAKKDHKCYECRGVIKKGDRYEKTSGVWDGTFDTFKVCLDCLSLRKEFFRGGYYYGRIWEDFETHVDAVGAEISEKCLSNMTHVARGRACDIIQAWWDEDDEMQDDEDEVLWGPT